MPLSSYTSRRIYDTSVEWGSGPEAGAIGYSARVQPKAAVAPGVEQGVGGCQTQLV
jgi:hypothetical protein